MWIICLKSLLLIHRWMWVICLLSLILCNHGVSCTFIILFSLKVRQSRIWLTEVISKQEIHRPTIKWSSGMYLNLSCTLESFIYSLACMIFSNIHTIPIQSQQRETWSLKLNLQSNNPLFIPPTLPIHNLHKTSFKKNKNNKWPCSFEDKYENEK